MVLYIPARATVSCLMWLMTLHLEHDQKHFVYVCAENGVQTTFWCKLIAIDFSSSFMSFFKIYNKCNEYQIYCLGEYHPNRDVRKEKI